MNDRTSEIFGNKIDKKIVKKAGLLQKKYLKKFGDDSQIRYHLGVSENNVLTPAFDAKIITITDNPVSELPKRSVIIGTTRMNIDQYRTAIAMASAVKSFGFTPLWLDLNSFPETTGSKVIETQNRHYSVLSKLIKSEKMNFQNLMYNAYDQKISELMTPVFHYIPNETPLIAVHSFAAQSAVHAGLTNVVNAIPHNCPMAIHLAEGSVHTVQTHPAYFAYRSLRAFDEKRVLKPMKDKDIKFTGHYVDYEIVENIENDCFKRIERMETKRPLRFLISNEAGDMKKNYLTGLLKVLQPYIKSNKAVVYLNAGGNEKLWDIIKEEIPELESKSFFHFNSWNEVKEFAENAYDEKKLDAKCNSGIHIFRDKDIYASVYTTNLLMRSSDVLISNPNALSFYPVPKLLVENAYPYEKWNASHSSELGDGIPKCISVQQAKSMVVQLIECPSLIEKMCTAIICAKNEGFYNGAYHAVEIACNLNSSVYKYAGDQ